MLRRNGADARENTNQDMQVLVAETEKMTCMFKGRDLAECKINPDALAA